MKPVFSSVRCVGGVLDGHFIDLTGTVLEPVRGHVYLLRCAKIIAADGGGGPCGDDSYVYFMSPYRNDQTPEDATHEALHTLFGGAVITKAEADSYRNPLTGGDRC
jgi:hypothetical protein